VNLYKYTKRRTSGTIQWLSSFNRWAYTEEEILRKQLDVTDSRRTKRCCEKIDAKMIFCSHAVTTNHRHQQQVASWLRLLSLIIIFILHSRSHSSSDAIQLASNIRSVLCSTADERIMNELQPTTINQRHCFLATWRIAKKKVKSASHE